MKYFSNLMACVCLLLAGFSTQAGLYNATVHSRANCPNNESISWWREHSYNWQIVSVHKYYQFVPHIIDTGFNLSDRVAAICWGEGVNGGSVVWGYHYLKSYHDFVFFGSTFSEGCNTIEDWDQG